MSRSVRTTLSLSAASLVVLLCGVTGVCQKNDRPRRAGVEMRASSQTRAPELTARQRRLCLEILRVLDRSDVVLSTAKDGAKFRRSLRRLKPLIGDARKKLPEGGLKESLLSTATAYTDVSAMMILGEQRQRRGARAIDDDAADFLADVALRYRNVLGRKATLDMLDPGTTAKVYAVAIKSKQKARKLVA